MRTFYRHKRTLGDDEAESGDHSENESATELDPGSQTDDQLVGNIRELNITVALRLHYNKHKTVCILCIGTEPDCPSIGDSEVNDTIFEYSEHSSNELEDVSKCLQPSTECMYHSVLLIHPLRKYAPPPPPLYR